MKLPTPREIAEQLRGGQRTRPWPPEQWCSLGAAAAYVAVEKAGEERARSISMYDHNAAYELHQLTNAIRAAMEEK